MICLYDSIELKRLRNEVQMLRDELAIMKRKYEDIIYNLDTDNFSSRFTKEQGDMRAAIEFTAEGIKTVVTRTEELKDKVTSAESRIEQTEKSISTQVSKEVDGKMSEYSTTEQTVEAIRALVTKGVVKDEAIEVKSSKDFAYVDCIYVIRQKDENDNITSEEYYYYSDISEKWEVLSGHSICTVFEQTSNGFKLRGNVEIIGNLFKTVDDKNGHIMKIENGVIYIIPPDSDIPKMQIGTYEGYDNKGTPCPFIIMGAGTGEGEKGKITIYKDSLSGGIRFHGSDDEIHGIWFYDVDSGDVSGAFDESFMSFGESIIDFSGAKDIRWGLNKPTTEAVFGE